MADHDSANTINKRTRGDEATATTRPSSTDSDCNRMQCASCTKWIPLTNFSKAQQRKGQNQGRCKPCVNSQAAVARSAKKQKKAALSNIFAFCWGCLKNKNLLSFPRDQINDPKMRNTPVCVVCVVERHAFPRQCQGCEEVKPKDQYAESQHYLPRDLTDNDHSDKTTPHIEAMAKQAFQREKITCQACKQIKREKALQESQEKELAMKRHLKLHGIEFYDYESPVPAKQYSQTKPTNLSGTYDIVFHSGWLAGEEIESRTTKGTVTITEGPIVRQQQQQSSEDEEDDGGDNNNNNNNNSNGNEEEEGIGDADEMVIAGKVEFLPAMRPPPSNAFFQQDFALTHGSHSYSERGRSIWVCHLRAPQMLAEFFEEEYCRAYLKCITHRAAIPWMKYEEAYSNRNEEGDNIVTFETLDEAEALAHEHEQGPDVSNSWLVGHKNFSEDLAKRIHAYLYYKPKPVFFLEPGDLVLEVSWSGANSRTQIYTDCVLRRRSD